MGGEQACYERTATAKRLHSVGVMTTLTENLTPATTTPWTCDCRDEVTLDQLSPGDRLLVTTGNHTYEIVVECPETGEVRLCGGEFFPEFSTARLVGSFLGGSALEAGRVCVGLRLEFIHEDRAVIITHVHAIRVIPVAASRAA
jgi:hypothetical protein